MVNNEKIKKPFDPATVLLQDSNLIEASAGTGKTYSIAILVLRLVLEKKIPIGQILMVTFTKAAVAELETRIRQFIRNALKASQGAAINDETIVEIVRSSMDDIGPAETQRLLKEAVLFLDETAILTIHSFCQRVLTEFAFETRQIFGSEILTDIKTILTDRVNAFWRKRITTLHTPLLHELINAKLSRKNLVDVMMNASSGKTILPLEPLPADFLSATHQLTVYESLKEMTDQMAAIKAAMLDIVATNFDALKLSIERDVYAKKNKSLLVNDPSSLLDAIIDNKDKGYVQKLFPEILLEYERIVSIEDVRVLAVKSFISQLYKLAIEIISVETELHKQQNNQLAFDDMITKLHTAVVVDNNEFLITSLQAKYKAAFIDEFQDTDKMQYEIFNRLFANEAVLFYIGDPKQSIYAWRKADISTYFKAAGEVKNIFEMDINYRSSRRFIDAMNHFFLPMADFDTFYFLNETSSIEYTNVAAPADVTKGELYKDQNADVPITVFENPNNTTISESVVAQIIALLTDDGCTLEENGKRRTLRPSDIGILVRKNKQAAQIKQLLSKYRIPAVTIDDSKLLQSAEARHLLYLLTGVIDTNASSINKALLSPLTGFKADDILAMDDELALNRFKSYQLLFEQEGVYVMLNRFIADYKVKQVLLNELTENGERIITNVLQLMEVLHKVQIQKQFSPVELVNWLLRGIEGMVAEGDEFEQRVESDEEAVKIVTIHKSKGLEYNIVFAPFLDLPASTDFEFVTFRDNDTGDYLFSDSYLLNNDQLRLTEKQLEQENRRLIYVALTRAVYKCYLNKNTHHSCNESAISCFVNTLKQHPHPLVAFEPSPALPAYFKYAATGQRLKPAYLQATNFQLTEVNWRKLSYTWLDAGHDNVFKPLAIKKLEGYDEFVFKQLKRGANTGNLLHFIFERIDFAEPTYWETVIATALKRYVPNAPAEFMSALLQLLSHVTDTKIRIGNETFTLQKLEREKRLNELEFDFNVAPFSTEAVNRLSGDALPFRLRFAEELEGIMNGKIDLFFEHAGKYFILDWKSNFLGNQAEDYSGDNLQLAMSESNYHLQYLIYTLAVKKYLALRIPGFDYATHFGGVIYLFVRGIRKGSTNGVFVARPEESFINRLELLLSKEAEV
ncbi:MAG: exodeoxyribonuclease V subunit beta [Ferruginibacter sp.]